MLDEHVAVHPCLGLASEVTRFQASSTSVRGSWKTVVVSERAHIIRIDRAVSEDALM